MTTINWQVQRHSGRSDGTWRTLYDGPEDRARQRFDREALHLRQGGVLLLAPDRSVADSVWAPRLRTQW